MPKDTSQQLTKANLKAKDYYDDIQSEISDQTASTSLVRSSSSYQQSTNTTLSNSSGENDKFEDTSNDNDNMEEGYTSRENDLESSTSSDRNQNDNSLLNLSQQSNDPPVYKRLTRTVQSYLQATETARNFVSIKMTGHRVKRLSTFNLRKAKSNDSSSHNIKKFETKNILLNSLLQNYSQSRSLRSKYNSKSNIHPKNVAKNILKLKNLFSNFESYFVTILMSSDENFDLENKNNSLIDNSETNLSDENPPEDKNERKHPDFYTCPLCSHCLSEPVTLICGCTYCKYCLREYYAFKSNSNSKDKTDVKSKSIYKSLENISYIPEFSSDSEINLEKERLPIQVDCFNCGKKHEKNNPDQLKVNTLIALIVEKLWTPNLLIKKLRNDIRSFVVFDLENTGKINVGKYEYLYKQAMDKDRSNPQLLADLFFINHLSGNDKKALEYANEITILRPDWIIGYYFKTIIYGKKNNRDELKKNLQTCLKIDPTLHHLKTYLDSLCDITESNARADHQNKVNNLRKKDSEHFHGIIKPRPVLHTTLRKKLTHIKKIDSQSFDSITSTRTFLNKKNTHSLDNKQSNESSLELCSYKSSNSAFSNQIVDSSNEHNLQKPKSQSLDGLNANILTDDKEASDREEINNLLDENSSDFRRNESNFESTREFFINPNLLTTSDLECSLCYRLIYNPVSTPCGHSYCSSCLDRSLDHQDKCPLCKSSLADYLAERRQFQTVFIDSLIKNYFVVEFEDRKSQHIEELNELTNNENEVPIFVCTLALPFAPCPLHIYEPRYRLMLRRAIEAGSNQFGMCMYGESTPYHFTEYGCMLEIQNYQFTRDGRAVVATVGGRRFKVIKVNNKDGYYVAKVAWVIDKRVEDEAEKAELQSLHDEVYTLATNWYSFIPAPQKQKIFEIYGISEMPVPEENIQDNDNGPLWSWFLLNILPLDNDFQYRFLTKTSLKERLRQIKRIVLVLLSPLDRSLVTSNSDSRNTDRSAAGTENNQNTNHNIS